MAFGGGSKPAYSIPTPKVVQAGRPLGSLTIPKAGAKAAKRPAPGKAGCCGNR